MTGDEMERAIEFILRNQANYEAKQAEHQARQAELEARLAAERVETEARLAAERGETDRRIRELSAAQDRTQGQLDLLSEQVSHLRGVVSALAEGQRRSRDDIDALVKLVGGLVEGRNGGGGAPG